MGIKAVLLLAMINWRHCLFACTQNLSISLMGFWCFHISFRFACKNSIISLRPNFAMFFHFWSFDKINTSHMWKTQKSNLVESTSTSNYTGKVNRVTCWKIGFVFSSNLVFKEELNLMLVYSSQGTMGFSL